MAVEMEKMGFSCEAEHSGSSSHSGDPFSGTESERDILELESEAGTPAKRMKAFFADLNWKDVLTTSCLWLAYFLCNVAFSLIAPFFPEEAESKGASTIVIGAIIAFSPLSMVLFSPIVGYLLPLLGVQICILFGLFLVGGTFLSLGFVTLLPSNWVFIFVCILLRSLEGGGTAMFTTAAFSTFPKFFPKSVSKIMAIFAVGAAVGYCLGRPIGGLLYEVGGFKVPFISVGSLILAIAIPCTLVVRKMRVHNVRKERILPWIRSLQIILDLYFIVVAQGLAFGMIAIANCTPSIGQYLIHMFGITEFQVSLFFLFQSVAFFLSNFPAGIISDMLKRSNIYVIVFGLVVAALGEFIIGIQDYISIWKYWIFCVGITVIGIGGAFSIVPVYSNLLRIARRHSSSAQESEAVQSFVSGIVASTLSLGQVCAYLLGGLLNEFMSFPESSVVIGEMILFEALLLIGVDVVDRWIWTDS